MRGGLGLGGRTGGWRGVGKYRGEGRTGGKGRTEDRYECWWWAKGLEGASDYQP